MTEPTATIGGLLKSGRYHYQPYDIGRGVTPLDLELFRQFETGATPYPLPLQQHAWIGLLGWNPDNHDEHFIWFLKFPLDELGILNQAARDDFLAQLIEAFEAAHGSDKPVNTSMDESPYGIRPREETMALFHARALQQLGLPPSRHFNHAHSYFSGSKGFEQWAFIGLQGIADLAARLDEGDNSSLIANAIPQLPAEPFIALCSALESSHPDASIATAVATRLREQMQSRECNTALLAAGVRGLATATDSELRSALLEELLDSDYRGDIELLAAITGRCWSDLKEPELARKFLEALAVNSAGEDGFNAIVADLLFIPGMRDPILQVIRNPERSEALSAAIGKLFG